MLAYYIVSHAGNGLCLSVEATGTITGRTNVSLSPMTIENKNQLWLLSSSSMTGIEVSTANNPAYMLNARKSTWNCDVYTSNADTVLNFLYTSDNCYKIQLSSDPTRYLTASSALTAAVVPSGSNVDWKTASSANANAQLWKLVQTSIPDPPTEKILSMPAGRNCNWNQFYQGIYDAIGSLKGCTITAVLDVLNFYGPDSYEMSDIKAAWNSSSGIDWSYNWPGNAKLSSRIDISGSAAYAKIREQILLGFPVLVNLGTNVTHNHTVMCYGYTNGGASDADFLVMDPAGKYLRGENDEKLPSNEVYGHDWTIARSMIWNHKPEGIWKLICTSPKA